jgi:ABC-type proline/glycine betaine transport system permease subunit
MVDSGQILAGAIPAAVLALAADFGLGRMERRWGRFREGRRTT